MTKAFSPYADFEQVGKTAMKVALSAEGDGDDAAARVVTLGQDYPLAALPPVQLVICFDEEALKLPADDPRRHALVGFREQNGNVKLIPSTPQDVLNGLRNLQAVMRKLLRNGAS